MASRFCGLLVALVLLAAPGATVASAALLSSSDRASFGRLSASLGGRSGIAVSALGRGRPVTELGVLHGGVAWSTIKTAIAVATYNRTHGHPDAATRSLLRRAITASDNAAAQKLWDELGGGTRAAATVQAVLAQAGDTHTVVQARVTRPSYTAFGQTPWSLTHQTRFMAGMPCLTHGLAVMTLMTQVIASQRWGLGSAGVSALLKGGWGPSASGPYLVRQMGVLNFGSHSVAVTIATVPADGSFASGTANLTRIAKWLATHIDASSAPTRLHC